MTVFFTEFALILGAIAYIAVSSGLLLLVLDAYSGWEAVRRIVYLVVWICFWPALFAAFSTPVL